MEINANKFKKLERDFADLKQYRTRKEHEVIIPNIIHDLNKIFNFEVEFNIIYTGIYRNNCTIMCYPNKIDDKSNYINFITINMGLGIINLLEPRELIAILLHEFAHWHYNYDTYLPLLNNLIQKIRLIFGIGFITLASITMWPLFLLMLLISATSTTLLSHSIEYGCDENAVKYGYGADLYSAFEKLKKIQDKFERKNKIQVLFSTISDFLFGSSHPSFKNRIEKISDHLKNKYANIYNTPKQKKLIEKYYNIKV